MRRQSGGAELPTQPDAAGELAVPQPATKAGKARHERAIGQLDRWTFAFTIVDAAEKRVAVGTNALELLLGSRGAAGVVVEPAALERSDIACQVLLGWPDKIHRNRWTAGVRAHAITDEGQGAGLRERNQRTCSQPYVSALAAITAARR